MKSAELRTQQQEDMLAQKEAALNEALLLSWLNMTTFWLPCAKVKLKPFVVRKLPISLKLLCSLLKQREELEADKALPLQELRSQTHSA